MWTPGPLELIILLFAIFLFLIHIVIIRWVFRIKQFLYWSKQIHQKLEEISNLLKKGE